jgi:hypothetical protein
MRLDQVRGSCEDGKTCPALHRTDRGTVIAVGQTVIDPDALRQLELPPGESAIEIPADLVAEVLQAC